MRREQEVVQAEKKRPPAHSLPGIPSVKPDKSAAIKVTDIKLRHVMIIAKKNTEVITSVRETPESN